MRKKKEIYGINVKFIPISNKNFQSGRFGSCQIKMIEDFKVNDYSSCNSPSMAMTSFISGTAF